MGRVDPRTAGLEAQLDRLDDARLAGVPTEAPPDPLHGTFDPVEDGFGFHVDHDTEVDERDDEVPITEDPDGDRHDDQVDLAVLDTLVTAFNHRDLDDLLAVVASDGESPGLLGYDRANLGDAVADLWNRRPTVQVTRGRLDDAPVGVLWEHDGAAWWQLAVVCVDDVTDGRVGVVEFADDPDLLDRVRTSEPDADLLEGETWREWDEGTDGPGAVGR